MGGVGWWRVGERIGLEVRGVVMMMVDTDCRSQYWVWGK